MPSRLPPLRVVIGGTDYSTTAENISWSNADPGGCQTASFDIPATEATTIFPGDSVILFDGALKLWQGRVSEPSKAIEHGWSGTRRIGQSSATISCEGAGAVGKDNKMSMVYIDRELSRWQGSSVQRQFNLVGGGYVLGSFVTGMDPSSLNPSLLMQLPSPYNGTPDAEAWYDAGPGNVISMVWINMDAPIVSSSPALPASWFAQLWTSPSDLLAPGVEADNFATLPQKGFFGVTNNRYVALLLQAPNSNNTATTTYLLSVQPILFGNHGLSVRQDGSGGYGFYTSDIALHAARMCQSQSNFEFSVGQVDTIPGYVVPDYKQFDPVEHEQVIADMAKLGVVHYGWWPSANIWSDLPEFTFRNYATLPTAFASLADCDETDVSERLSDMYTSAIVTFSDAAGTPNQINLSLPNAVLDRSGTRRTQTYDLGTSSPSAAVDFASFALQALFLQQRTGGSLQISRDIRDANGASLPARRLRAGIDRIRVNDLPIRTQLLPSQDTDSFHISRVECQVDTTAGAVTTRIEIDSGPNLIETLQARFDAATRAGSG